MTTSADPPARSFECQHAKDALMHAPQRFVMHKALHRYFDEERDSGTQEFQDSKDDSFIPDTSGYPLAVEVLQ